MAAAVRTSKLNSDAISFGCFLDNNIIANWNVEGSRTLFQEPIPYIIIMLNTILYMATYILVHCNNNCK